MLTSETAIALCKKTVDLISEITEILHGRDENRFAYLLTSEIELNIETAQQYLEGHLSANFIEPITRALFVNSEQCRTAREIYEDCGYSLTAEQLEELSLATRRLCLYFYGLTNEN